MKTKAENTQHPNNLENSNLLSNREILTAMLKSWRQKIGYFSMFALPAMMTAHSPETRAGEANKPEMLPAGQNVKFLERLDKSSGKSPRRRRHYFLPHQEGKYNIISEFSGSDNCPGSVVPGGIYTAAAPYIDSGDTTGANNTVTSLDGYYYGDYSAVGADQIYSFTLTGRGPNPQIEVSATSANYKPMIYILQGRYGNGCPGGTNNRVGNWSSVAYASSPGGVATINSDYYLPLNEPLHLFIDSAASGANESGAYTLRIRDLTVAPAVPPRAKFDFDGDGKTDISVFRPSNGFWYLNKSTSGFSPRQFGLATDKLAPADYDGDGIFDIGVYRDGIWFWRGSFYNYFQTRRFGSPGDIPVSADFTGDGQAELAVYRGGMWFTLNLQNNQSGAVQFGLSTDKPVASDYDGDGRADYAVFRDGIWYLLKSQQGFAAIQFGLPTDKLVPADYDGDGKTDLAVYRNGIWYVQRSLLGFTAFQWGIASDTPAPADYDGDGKADAAVFRDGVWYLLQSASGVSTRQFGFATDKPVPAAYLP